MAMYLACEINLTLCMCVPDPLWPKYLSRHCPVSASHSLAERSVIKHVGGYYTKIQMQCNARLLLHLYIESPHHLICCYVIVIIECRESAERVQRFGIKLSFIGSHKVISFTTVTCSPLKIKPIDRLTTCKDVSSYSCSRYSV